MSNRAAGKRFEDRCKKFLESLGFCVDKARAATRWTPRGTFSSSNDFLGCADLLAVHPEKPYTLFVQCTLGDIGSRQRKMEAVPWCHEAQRVMVWSRQEGMASGIRSHRLGIWTGKEGTNSFKWDEAFFRMKDGQEPGVLN